MLPLNDVKRERHGPGPGVRVARRCGGLKTRGLGRAAGPGKRKEGVRVGGSVSDRGDCPSHWLRGCPAMRPMSLYIVPLLI